MKLIDYLAKEKQTYRQFGPRIGRSASEICRFALGKRIPSIGIALEIERVTGGEVTPADFVADRVEAA